MASPRKLGLLAFLLVLSCLAMGQHPTRKPTSNKTKGNQDLEAIGEADKFAPIGENNLQKFQRNGKYGCRDKTGKIIIPPEFDRVTISNTYGYVIVAREWSYGLFNFKGQRLLPTEYKIIQPSQRRLLLVDQEGKYGLCSLNGKLLYPCSAEKIRNYERSIRGYPIKSGGLWGLIDENGKQLIPANYNMLLPATGIPSMVTVQKDGRFGVLSRTNVERIPLQYDRLQVLQIPFKRGGLVVNGCIVFKDNKAGIVSMEHEELVPIVYDHLKPLNTMYSIGGQAQFLIFARKNKLTGVINTGHETLIPFEYTSLMEIPTAEGFIATRGLKWGFIDEQNHIKIPFEYSEISYLGNGLLICKAQNGKYGVRTPDLEIIPSQFEKEAISMDKDLLFVKSPSGNMLYHGKRAFSPFSYTESNQLSPRSSNVRIFKRSDGAQCLVDATGEPAYEEFTSYEETELKNTPCFVFTLSSFGIQELKGIRSKNSGKCIAPIAYTQLDFSEAIEKYNNPVLLRDFKFKESLIAAGRHAETNALHLIGSKGTIAILRKEQE